MHILNNKSFLLVHFLIDSCILTRIKSGQKKHKITMETVGFIFTAQQNLLLEVCLDPDHNSFHEAWISTQAAQI